MVLNIKKITFYSKDIGICCDISLGVNNMRGKFTAQYMMTSDNWVYLSSIKKYSYYNSLGMSLWDDNKYSGLDADSRSNIHETETLIDLGDYEIIDIKNSTNIWKYEGFNGVEESIELIKPKISDLEYNTLLKCGL